MATTSENVDAYYARTHERLAATDPEYRALEAAADLEAVDTPDRWIARNRLAFYVETHMPIGGEEA
mgnify:CR=1 FL=1